MKKFMNFINENNDDEWDEEEFDPNSQSNDKDKYNKFVNFLIDHGFDFYDGGDDFDIKWNDTISNNELTIGEKSEIITGYLDEKWGLYDGYDEVYGFLNIILK